jgi:carbon storage regulator
MLVLSRKLGEVIVIGDHIRITIVAVLGDKVRLGIAAPPEVIVDRQEIHEKRVTWSDAKADPAIYKPVP